MLSGPMRRCFNPVHVNEHVEFISRSVEHSIFSLSIGCPYYKKGVFQGSNLYKKDCPICPAPTPDGLFF